MYVCYSVLIEAYRFSGRQDCKANALFFPGRWNKCFHLSLLRTLPQDCELLLSTGRRCVALTRRVTSRLQMVQDDRYRVPGQLPTAPDGHHLK
jgi:hypothetical protein